MIKIKSYVVKDVLITNEILTSYVSKFWHDVYSPIKDNHHLMLICRLEYSDKELGYKTLGPLRRVNYSDKALFIEYLTERLGIIVDSYTSLAISHITFSYIVKKGISTDQDRKLLQDLSENTVTDHRFNNLKLPITMNPAEYGKILTKEILDSFTRYIVTSRNLIFQIDVSLDRLINNVKILGASELSWVDIKLSEGFKREIGKSTIYFFGGDIVLRKQLLPAKPFKSLKVDPKVANNFVTMDIETVTINNKVTPYLISAYNGKNFINSYGEYTAGVINQSQLFISFFLDLLTLFNKKSNTLTVYAHNLSGFDGVFLLRHLFKHGKVEPLIFNGKLMSIKLKLNTVGYVGKTIIFKDSYLLLPLSLRKLCVAFNVLTVKGFFPFRLVDIIYKGVFPKFEYFSGISLNDYNKMLNEFTGKYWSFRDEAIKYCYLDCKCLHEVLTSFNELIFNHFQINIPHNRLGNFFVAVKAIFIKLYYYDVNSLYPTAMAKALMPMGKPTYFEGDIRKFHPQAFGFFYCKITSPDNILHPIIQRRIKTVDGIRTIAGLGSWLGWISSSEMDNAVKLGYQFEIFKGYQFETGDLFSSYVNKMYNLRLEYESGSAMNLIAKLLMNSLYGKFGMRLVSTRLDIYNVANNQGLQEFTNMIESLGETVEDYIKIDDNYIILRDAILDVKSKVNYSDSDSDFYHGQDVNIAIASAITAEARIFMSKFKNNPNFKLYYSDTDSIVIDAELSESAVGSALGQLKLEYIINNAVFLAPKVYGFITESGDEVIKVKGIKENVASTLNINDLEDLLVKDSTREFTQEKWYKKLIEGEITISDIAYTLKVTSNKRSPIYIDNVFSNTKPFNYDEIIKK
jgi:hypothetical protein